MKKRIKILTITLSFLLSFPILSFSQEITEENYLKADKEIWSTLDWEMAEISASYKLYPNKKDSLAKASKRVYDLANKKNGELAIKYASVPSGLKRLFMVRLQLSKDTLLSVLKTLPQDMQSSKYGKSLLLHINSKQIEEKDKYYDFEATDADGKSFQFSSLKGKSTLLLYGGLDCMGQDGRDFLTKLYGETSRDNFQIVVYCPYSDLKQLKELKEKFPSEYIFVSDFLLDQSPVKIRYGAQALPTCFLIDKEGTVLIKSEGLPEKRLTRLKEQNIL